jgi:ribosomal protein S15P/S13E
MCTLIKILTNYKRQGDGELVRFKSNMPYCKFNTPHYKHGINSNNFLLLNFPCQWSKCDCWELRNSLAHVAHKPHFGKKYQFLITQINKLHKRIKEHRHKQTSKQNFSLMHMHIHPLSSIKPNKFCKIH